MNKLDYVGRKACGCLVGWAWGEGVDLADIVAGWLRDGLSVERLSTEEARKQLTSCKCESAP